MKGVLLVNLGTPDSPSPSDVAKYLAEFLSDPRVVDLPRWLWLPLLKLVIIRLRRNRSAEAYRKIWTDEGSPLLVESEKLANKLSTSLEGEAVVRLAMCYGKPDIRSGLMGLKDQGVEQLVVLPLYPQYSGTTTEAVFDSVTDSLRELDWFPELKSIQKYHDAPGWISAVADSIRQFQRHSGQPEKLVFSLHGIPQRYVANGDPYAAQCEQSVRDIVGDLGLEDEQWILSFQSRVGREPWLQPYTDFVLRDLAQAGVKKVQVICPGFAVDCLETLEEIAMQNAELFQEHGGESLEYIPALNDSDAQVSLMDGLVRT
jgi:ferrochelatase